MDIIKFILSYYVDTIYLDCEKSELYDTENSNNSETSQTDGTAVKLIKSSLNFIGHRQSSSYDTSNINKNESDKEVLYFLIFLIVFKTNVKVRKLNSFKCSPVVSQIISVVYLIFFLAFTLK